jgi:hypothetical protein
MTPTTSIEKITPAIAKQLLDNQEETHKNRSISRPVVRKYKRAIQAGDWKLTHQGIAIDSKGNILDGQHRLKAISEADKAVTMQVMRNAPSDNFDVIDIGRKRTAAHVLTCVGVERHASLIASVVRQYILYTNYPKIHWSGEDIAPSGTDSKLWYTEKSSSIHVFLPHMNTIHRGFKCFSKASAIAVSLIAEDAGWKAGEILDFWELVGTGANLDPDSIILSFRNQLSSRSIKKHAYKSKPQTDINSMIKCFNMHQQGKKGKFFTPPAPPMMEVVARGDVIENPVMQIIRRV